MFQVYGMPGVARPQLPVSLGTRAHNQLFWPVSRLSILLV